MKNQKLNTSIIIGSLTAFAGVYLRLSAKALAWPQTFSYSGPRENTEWATREQAYQDIGLVLMVFGLAILLAAFVKWLNS